MDIQGFFYDNGTVLLRTLIIGVSAYACLVVVLRVSGKRTLSKMNAFDFIVTIALGSTLASVLTSKDVALAQGVLALALLVGLQYVITWTSVRAQWVRRWVTGDPALLVYRGRWHEGQLRRTRVTRDEVRAAVRSAGLVNVEDAEAVVLETDGSFSVVWRGSSAGEGNAGGAVGATPRSATALAGVERTDGATSG